MSPQTRQNSLKFFVCKHRWLVRTTWMMGLSIMPTAGAYAVPPGSASSASTSPAAPPTGIHYTQGNFTLPFQVKPGGRCPQHLDLMVSRDSGRSWTIHQTAAPAEGRFQFNQVEEGQYWLKVQVRDKAASSLSQSTMRLCVDRTRPRATTQCDWQGDSSLLYSSTVEDPNLDPTSLTLTLRTDANSDPITVPLQLSPAPAPSPATTTAFECRATLEVLACKSFELRLTALDRAGNRLIASERYFHPVLATEQDVLLPATEETETPSNSEQPPELQIAKTEWTAIELGSPQAIPKTQLASVDSHRSVVRKPATRGDSLPEELIPPDRPAELSLEPPAVAQPAVTGPVSTAPVPPLPPTSSVRPQATSQVNSTSRKFKINYALAESVPSGQLNVELWVTTDNGATWEFWGLDRDAQSPAWIEVDRDGEFGFCVVCVHSEADLQFRPNAGDRPDLAVTVKEPPVKRRLQPAAHN